MALDRLTKIDGGGISTTSDYRVGIITASKFVGPFDGTGGNFSGVITATDGVFSGNVTIGGTLTYEDVTNIDSVGLVTARDGIFVPDDKSIRVGGTFANPDFKIHSSSTYDQAVIDYNRSGTGRALRIRATNLQIENWNGLTPTAKFIGGVGVGHVELNYAGNKKFETTAKGIQVGTGVTIETNGQATYTGIVTANTLRLPDATSGSLGRVQLGNGLHFTMYHDGTNSFLVNNNGYLSIQSQVGVGGIFIARNAEVNLYYGGSVRLQTSSAGITVNRDLDVDGHTNLDNVSIAGVTTIADDKKLYLGNDQDLELYYQTSGTPGAYVQTGSASGNLTIRNSDAGQYVYIHGDHIHLRSTTGNEAYLQAQRNGAVKLWYDSSTYSTAKLTTTATGVTIDGTAVVGGLDISGDIDVDGHTNLDNVSIAGVTTITSAAPEFHFTDTNANSDYSIVVNGGQFRIRDETNSANRLAVNSDGHVDIYGRLDAVGGFVASSNSAIEGNLELISTYPSLTWTDTNHDSDFRITNDDGQLIVYDISRGAHVLDFKSNGDLHFRHDKNLIIGEGSDLKIFHDSSANNNVIEGHLNSLNLRNYNVNCTDIVLSARRNILLQTNLNETAIQCIVNGATEIFHDGGATPKLRTTATGIQVLGEVATEQDYPNIRPVLDFNFAATKKLRPEMTFTRDGEASFHDGVGSVKFVSTNEPRFEHDIVTGECKGLMFEQAGTNYSWYSRRFDVVATSSWVKVGSASITANTHTAPDGTSSGIYMADKISGADGTTFNGNVLRQQITAGAGVKHTFSIYIKLITSTQATIYVRDGATGSTATANAISNTRNWQRVVVTSNNALTNGTTHSFYVGNTNGDIAVWGAQIERSDYVTSYIKTEGGANGTRNTDKGVHLDGEDVTDVFNQGEGTLIAEAILTQSLSNNPIVGFYEDFGSHNRLELRGDASAVGTARLEAVVGGSSVTSLTTNLGHSGVNNVSKYAYAFQENNYAGCVNGGSVTTDTSSTFPHGTGIDSMMIGEAVYNVDAAVIVKRIMYYADRLPNSQLVTLTS